MADELQPIRDALKAGDKRRAQELLRPLLSNPSADLWYLAALASTNADKAKQHLRRALELEPWHSEADRLLDKLERTSSQPPQPVAASDSLDPKLQAEALYQQAVSSDTDNEKIRLLKEAVALDPWHQQANRMLLRLERPQLVGSTPADVDKSVIEVQALEAVKEKRQQRRRGCSTRMQVGCLLSILLSLSSSVLVMTLLGVATGLTQSVKVFMGGATPISEWEGVPIREVREPAVVLPAEKSDPIAENQSVVDTLNSGYVHEYKFPVTRGTEIVVYVQFLSPVASAVSENLALVDEEGNSVESQCTRGTIVQGTSNVAFTCSVPRNDNWKVRIFGLEGESTGVYFVSVAELDDL